MGTSTRCKNHSKCSRRQEGQHFDEHFAELRTLAEACEFLENDNTICHEIVFLISEKSLQEGLLREVDLSPDTDLRG